MGYFKNLEIGKQVEVGDRGRRATHIKPVGVVVLSTKLLTTMLTLVWLQLFVTAGLLVWVATK